MLQRRWFVAVVVLAASAVPAFGQDTVELKWKFEKDKPFYQEVTTTTTQEHTVAGNKVNQSQVQTFYLAWTPLREECDNWTLKEKCLGVKMDQEILVRHVRKIRQVGAGGL